MIPWKACGWHETFVTCCGEHLISARAERPAYLAGHIWGQPGYKEVAKLVGSSHSVIVQWQSCCEVTRSDVVSILIQHILSLLIFEVVHRFLHRVAY